MAQGLTLEQLQKMGAKPVQRVGGGLTAEQLQAQGAKPQTRQVQPTQPKGVVGAGVSAGMEAVGNLIPSAIGFGKGIVSSIVNPIETVKGIGGILSGAGSKVLEGTVGKGVEKLTGKQIQKADTKQFDQFAQALKQRYGSLEALEKTATEDPFAFGVDVLTVVGGGAGLLGKGKSFSQGISKTTQIATKPITVPAKVAGRIITDTLGVTTGAGGEAVRTALKGGKDFTEALRGKTSMQDVLQESQDAVSRLKNMRSQEYQAKLANIKTIKKSLDISPIQNTLQQNLKNFNVKPINGEITPASFSRSVLQNDASAQATFKTIYDNLKTYGTQAGDRTPIALDTLKRSLADLYSENSSVRSFTQAMTDSVKTVLKKEVPGYEAMTKEYSNFSNLLKDIKQNLAIGGKAGEEAAIKRLSGALKQNNELRLEVLQDFEKATGINLKDKIAGAALGEKIPRGFIGKGIDLYALSSMFSGILEPSAFAQILITSPRFVGELMNALGLGARGIWKVVKPINESPMIIMDIGKRREVIENIRKTPIGMGIKDVTKEGQAFNQPTQIAKNTAKNIPSSISKYNTTKLGVKAIPEATKAEMVKAIDYLRIGKKSKDIEQVVTALARKYGINEDLSNTKIANKFEDLIDNTKTISTPREVLKKSNPTVGKTAIGETPLIQEARKYKSAEEFVKAQGKYYHGTNAKFDNFDISKRGVGADTEGFGDYGNGFYFTRSPQEATGYAEGIAKRSGGKPNVIQTHLDIKRPFDMNKLGEVDSYVMKGMSEGQALKKLELNKKDYDTFKDISSDMEDNWGDWDIAGKLKNEGYDAIYTPNGEVVVFDSSQIKTKSQLTDIWNKANKK